MTPGGNFSVGEQTPAPPFAGAGDVVRASDLWLNGLEFDPFRRTVSR